MTVVRIPVETQVTHYGCTTVVEAYHRGHLIEAGPLDTTRTTRILNRTQLPTAKQLQWQPQLFTSK